MKSTILAAGALFRPGCNQFLCNFCVERYFLPSLAGDGLLA